MSRSDNFPDNFSGDLPGEQKHECMFCEGKFIMAQLYTAGNGDCCCLWCYDTELDDDEKERFE